MTAAVAHEGNNVLLGMQITLGMLEKAARGDPEVAGHVARLRAGQGQLRRLFEEIRGHVAAVRPEWRACELRSVWREAHRTVTALRMFAGGAGETCPALGRGVRSMIPATRRASEHRIVARRC